MASFWKRKFHERMLVLLLCLVLAVQSTGCANVVNHLGKGYDREDSSKDGEDVPSDIPDFDPNEKEDTKHREKKDIDYSIDRFNIEGTNAFYILPGLENIPDAMAVFEVLDYNRLGEFVYYYVTPCYITPDEFEQFAASNRNGTVKDRTGVTVPEGRREDYEYDAGVLMAYNPDTGNYRIMYANAFAIDKEKEFDPATQGRPYMYKGRDMDGDNKKRVYLAERLLGCKVAGRQEYLLMDQDSLLGVVYDAKGNAIKTMSYRTVLGNQMENMKHDMKDEKDHGNKKIMNAAVTDLAMTKAYESYLAATFFMGDYDKEDDIDEDDLQISQTMLIYRQSLGEEDGAIPFISVNKNADRQREKWLSLDGRFFESRSVFENAEGCRLSDLKNGKYGDEYADDFSAFTMADSGEESVTFQVQIPNFYDIDRSWYDNNFTNDLIDSVLASDPKARFDFTFEGSIGYSRRRLGLFEQFITDGWGNGQVSLRSKIEDLNYGFSIMHKRISQIILSDVLQRRMKAENMTSASMGELETFFENKGFLPKPGKYDEKRNLNESPEGFYGDPEKRSKVEREEWDPGVSIVSDHIVNVTSQNGIYADFLAPVDYFPEGDEDWEKVIMGTIGVRMEPVNYTDAMERTVYIYDTAEADRQISELLSAAGLSADERKAVEELKLLLRASSKEWGNVKLAWLLKEILEDPEGLKDTVSNDAARAVKEGRISDGDKKRALELLERILNNDENNTVHETFEKARQDAKKKHDDGGLSDEEYERVIDTLDRAEKEKLGLSDEDWAVFRGLAAASSVIADANSAIVSSNLAGKNDTVSRIEALAGGLPEEIRQAMLYLCAGFQIVMEREDGCPLSYKTVFPQGSSIMGYGSGQMMTAGGSLDSDTNGVVVLGESEGKAYAGNAFLIGYESSDRTDLFDKFTFGKPIDISSMEYNDGKDITTVIAVCTDKGVRFFKKDRAREGKKYSNGDLKKLFGQVNADLICGLKEVSWYFNHVYYNNKVTLYNSYSPLDFKAVGDTAFESLKKETELPSGVGKGDFKGFLTYRMLLTSSGYTRDIENRLTDAIEKSLEAIGARERDEEAQKEREAEGVTDEGRDLNDRYTGHLNSAKNICMIDRNKALICSVTNGTKILDLDHGTVADDIEGSYYRAFQEGSKKTYRLLGFANTSDAYLDVDLPLAKVYTTQYRDADIDRSEIEAFKKMLLQYAKDYLYREYRTRLDKDGQVVLVEKTEKEQKESIEAGKIFDPAVKGYEGALLELEKKYGIDMTPEEIRSYTEMLRDRVAGVAPSITRLYELAGAKKLAGDMAKRNTGYWKNVESRMTMAVDPSDMKDVLVEIRMNDEVLNSLPSDIADKYRTYKNILDPANEHISVSSGDIYGRKTASLNEAESEKARLRSEYREDVISDMVREYGDSLVNSNTAGKALPTDQEIKKEFDDLVLALLNRVNPDNILLDDQNTVDEFADLVNHGKERLEGERFETFRDGIREGMSDINSVWLLEELVIRKKVEQGGAYSGFEVWLKEYDEKVREASSSMAGLKLPDVKNGKNKVEEDKGLSGDERISYLRTSAAYKSIIGDIKQDPAVKEFLAGRKETWDDYCQYVVKKAGLGISEDEE